MKKPINVLMVEDNEADAELLKRMLKKGDYVAHCRRVETQAAFTGALDEQTWDLILCDYRLPGFSGLEALGIYMKRELDIPFIFVSGTMGEEVAVDAMTKGAHDYVMKNNLMRLLPAIDRELKEAKVRVERREAIEKLKASEVYYRSLTEASPDALIIIDMKGEIAFVSPKALDMFGVPPGQMVLGVSVLDWVLAEDHGLIRERLQVLASDGSMPTQRELRLLKNDRTQLWGEINSSPIADEKGQTVGLLIACRDISDRKRVEEALRQSEFRYRAVLQSANDAIITADRDGHISGWNKGAERIFGYGYVEIVGQPLTLLMPEGYRADHSNGLRRLQSGGDPHIVGKTVEVKGLRRDGTEFPLELSLSTWEVPEGKFFTGIIRDITDRKRVEESLAQERYLLTMLTDNVPDHIYFKDTQGRFIRINAALAKSFGLTDPAEAFGKTDAHFFTHQHAQKAHDNEQAIIRTGQPILGVEERETWSDGRVTWVSTTKMPLRDREGTIVGTFGISRDITARKQTEAAILESELRFRSVWNNSADGMRLTDREGLILDVNDAFCRLVKIPREELVGRIFSVAYQREGPSDDLSLYQKRFDANETISSLLGIATLRTGEVVDLEVTSSFIEITGQKKMLLSLFRDVTERKRSEAAVRESDLRFRSVWEHSADGMRLTDNLGRMIDVNDAYCRLVKMTREQLLGEIIFKIYKDQGQLEDIELYQQRFVTGGVVPRLAATIRLWNDDELDVEISNALLEHEATGNYLLSVFRDVTQRNKAEKRLEEERNLLRTIIDAIPDEIAVKDSERRFIVVNAGTVKALKRVSQEEIIGNRDEDLIPEHLLKEAKWEENVVLAVGGHSKNRVADKIDPETGEIEQSLLISKIPLKDNEGKIIGLVSVNRDITDLKRVEDMLQKERTLLLTLIESIPDEVCLKDLKHRYVVANGASLKALGATSLAALIGRTDRDFVPAAFVQEHFAEEDAIVELGEPVINQEQTKMHPVTGEIEKCSLTTKVPVKDQTGKTIGILVVNRNITDRKKAEEGLRASEEKFRSLFDESKDCIFITSGERKLMDINAAGMEMFGYGSKEELLGIDLDSVIWVDNPERTEFFRRVNVQGFEKDYEATMKRKDKQKLSVLITGAAVRDRQGNNVMYRGTIRDVTKQKEMEKQVGQAQKMESLGLLAGGIAHDFNNILGIILGHAAVVERAGNDPELVKNSIGEITTAVQRGASLVRQILTFARKSDAADEPIRVNATIRELAKMIDDTFPKTISLSLDLDKTIPIIMMDQTQLHQALLNLCVNARDAIVDSSTGNLGRGAMRIQTGVVSGLEMRKKFSEASASEYVCVAVSDTGKGMDEETKQKIYEPFFTTKERGKGTGLGLSVVYGIIKGHHGYIDVESTIGRGTTFRLYLPVTDALATPAAPREDGTPTDIRGKETILLVEDEQNLLGLMKSALERAGYTVLTAMDGISAIKTFSLNRQKIALVLTDLGLPKLDGAAVFTSMKDIDPNVKIILASGYLDPNLKSNLLRSGAKDFIQKPYSPNLVLRKIREVLDEKV